MKKDTWWHNLSGPTSAILIAAIIYISAIVLAVIYIALT